MLFGRVMTMVMTSCAGRVDFVKWQNPYGRIIIFLKKIYIYYVASSSVLESQVLYGWHVIWWFPRSGAEDRTYHDDDDV